MCYRLLEIPEGINFLTAKTKGQIMRRQGFGGEKFRQPVVNGRKTSGGIESPFGLENVFPEANDIVAGER